MSRRTSIAQLMRFAFAAFIALFVAVLASAGGGCGKGIFPEVTSSGTITPTPVANAFLYATNFNDGTISAFTRNTNTGALSFIAKQSAGAVGGPVGVVVTSSDDLVYAVNAADNNVYQYTIGSNGNLTSVGKIATDSTPQFAAIDSSDNYVYVTNFNSKTLTEYVINTSSRLALIGRISNYVGQPFGVVANPSTGNVYVNDNAGLIYAYSVGNNGLLTQIGTAVNSNGGSRGTPGQMAIAIDSSQSYLLVDDRALGVVSVFTILSGGGLTFSNTFASPQSSGALGIAAVNSGGGSSFNYVITANPNDNFLQPYQRSAAALTIQTGVAVVNGPSGLVIDPGGNFVYTGNVGSGTISLVGINNSQCGTQQFCVIQNYASENPANSNAGTQFVATTH